MTHDLDVVELAARRMTRGEPSGDLRERVLARIERDRSSWRRWWFVPAAAIAVIAASVITSHLTRHTIEPDLRTASTVAGARAVSQVKMEIHQRAVLDGVEVDVTCTGRFYDFLEKRDGRWGLVLRQPIYEQDRMDPVDPAARLELDGELLARFPEGYRHLAYLQARIGYDVKRDMPGLRGPEVEALYRSGAAWLAGEPLDR